MKVDIPFTGQDVDTDDDASSILMTVALVVLGFAVFAWAKGVGGYMAARANSIITSVVGFDPTSGEDSGADLV